MISIKEVMVWIGAAAILLLILASLSGCGGGSSSSSNGCQVISTVDSDGNAINTVTCDQ